jgi:hypothetical protein
MKYRGWAYVASGLMLILSDNPASAADSANNLPLVFDPQTKKYFIGGTSKFLLKQSEQSSLIDRIEVSVDGGEYHSYGDAIEFKNEGKHALKFRAVNPVNNWSPVQFVEVFVDMTPPTTEAKFTDDKFYKGESGIYVQQSSKLSLVSQDNLSGVATIEWSRDGSSWSTYDKPIAFDKAGKNTIWYRSTDRVGNIEQAKKMDVIVDGTPPTSELKLVGSKPAFLNGRNYVSDSVAFQVEAKDDSSSVKQTWVVVDGKEQPYIKPFYFLQEGPHTLAYYSVDNVGNKEELKTFSIYTVSIPPRTAASPTGSVVNTGGINYAKSDFSLGLEAHDNVVGLDRIEYKVDNEQDFKTYIQPIRFNTPGMHVVAYRSVDRAGNVEPTRTYSVDVTEVPPETSIATAQPFVVREGVTYSPAPNVITFNVGNSPVGVKQTLVSINDGPFVAYQGPITLGNDHKIYKIAYKSLDKLSNEEIPKTMTFHMIGQTPIVDLFISNGKNGEEEVRTNYLEQPGGTKPQETAAKPDAARGVASHPTSKAVAPAVVPDP